MFNFLCCRENTKTVVNTMISGQSLDDLYKKYGDRLRIPRRPQKDLWETAEELTRLENEHFLEWRKGLADLQDVGFVRKLMCRAFFFQYFLLPC